jgi:hypothetical protein
MKSLQSLLADLDRQFFRRRLTGYRIQWAYLPGGKMGCCDTDARIIKIRRGLRGEELRRVVLHEMCHHSVAGHGRLFEKVLRRLQSCGETWVEEEIAAYREAQPWRHMVKELVETAATEGSGLWIEAKKYISQGCGLSLREFDQRARWARKLWERERRYFLRTQEIRSHAIESRKQ